MLSKTKKGTLKRVLVGVAILAILWALLTLVVCIDERRFPAWLVDIVQKPLLLIDRNGPLIIFSLPGIVLAFVTLVPPIRKLTYENPQARKWIVLTVGLLSLLIMFVAWTLFLANINFYAATLFWEIPTGAYQTNQSSIIRELWLRTIIPPPLRWPCYTSKVEICTLADNVFRTRTPITTKAYLLEIMKFLPSASVGSGFAWLFTRQKKASFKGMVADQKSSSQYR